MSGLPAPPGEGGIQNTQRRKTTTADGDGYHDTTGTREHTRASNDMCRVAIRQNSLGQSSQLQRMRVREGMTSKGLEQQLQEEYDTQHQQEAWLHQASPGEQEDTGPANGQMALALPTKSHTSKLPYDDCTLLLSRNQMAQCMREGVFTLREDGYLPINTEVYVTQEEVTID